MLTIIKITQNSAFSKEIGALAPIVLPRKHYITTLIILEEHIKRKHAGTQATLYGVRELFWLIDGLNTTRRIIHQCFKCFQEKPSRIDYIMGNLPKTCILRLLAKGQLKQHFWSRWYKEYLNEMITRSDWKGSTHQNNIEVGTLIVEMDDNLPAMYWKLGCITKVHAGKDGHVRVVTLRNITGVYKRCIKKLYPLPIAPKDKSGRKLQTIIDPQLQNFNVIMRRTRQVRHPRSRCCSFQQEGPCAGNRRT